MQRLTLVAHFLRHESPLNPVPYLLLRAMRWGELRAAGATLNPALLEAPPTEKRTLIKKLSMEGNWAEVLENAEQAMSLPCGRGWLDLQRYAVRACEALGSEYEPVATGIRSELKTLLADYPDLAQLLAHGRYAGRQRGNANVAQREHIAATASCLRRPPSRSLSPAAMSSVPHPKAANGEKAPDVIELAMKAARAGKVQEAIGILTREMKTNAPGAAASSGTSSSPTFFLPPSTKPSLTRSWLNWRKKLNAANSKNGKKPSVVAQPLALLYRCAEKLGRDDAEKEKIYQKLCRLDPGQALSLR